MQQIPISQGVTLRHYETHIFQTRTYTIWFRRPLQREEATRNALLPAVWMRGCQAFPSARDIARHAETLCGAVFLIDVVKKGEEHLLRVSLETTRDVSAGDAIAFLRAVLFEPLADSGAFRKAQVDAAREALRKALLARENDKRAYARLRCVEELCRDEPFGVDGDGYASDIPAASPEALYAQHIALLSETAVDIITVGDMAAEALAAQLQHRLPFPDGHRAAPPPAGFAIPPLSPRIVEEAVDTSQGKLCIGLRAGIAPIGQAYCNLLVANALFGGGGNSMLFARVREKAQLCYYVSSAYYRFKSILLVESGLDAADFPHAEELIAESISHMQSGDFTQDALSKAKKTLARSLRTLADDPAALADFTVAQIIAGDSGGLNEVIQGIEAATSEGCRSAFAQVQTVLTYRLTQEGGNPYA